MLVMVAVDNFHCCNWNSIDCFGYNPNSSNCCCPHTVVLNCSNYTVDWHTSFASVDLGDKTHSRDTDCIDCSNRLNNSADAAVGSNCCSVDVVDLKETFILATYSKNENHKHTIRI